MSWRKSSYSGMNGNCLEVANWRKPLRSNGNSMCLEAGNAPAGVLVRDTKDRDGFTLAVPAGAWRAFTAALKGGAA